MNTITTATSNVPHTSPEANPDDLADGAEQLRAFLIKHRDPRVPYQTPLDAVHSFSRGYVYRTPGIVTGRIHHLQSRWEYRLFLLLDMSRAFGQILEGVPLPLALTRYYAAKKGYRHPHNWVRREDAVMTIDFLALDHEGTWIGLDFKQAHERQRPRVNQKLEIAASALSAIGIPHETKSEKDIPMHAVNNYRMLHALAAPHDDAPLSPDALEEASVSMRTLLAPGRLTIRDAATVHDAKTHVGIGRLIRAALWLTARGRWPVDLTAPVGPDTRVRFLPH